MCKILAMGKMIVSDERMQARATSIERMGLTSTRSAPAKHIVVDVELVGGVHLLEQVQMPAQCGTFCNLSLEDSDRESRGSQSFLIERETWGQARGWDGEEKKMKHTFKRSRVMGSFCLAAIFTSLFRFFR